MNAIQQFAQKYGKVAGNELARKYDDIAPEFSKAVRAVVGDKCSVADGFNDSRGEDFNEWSVILGDIDGKAPNTEIVLVLNTDLGNGKSWLECHCYDDDANLLKKVDGEVGKFDPLPLIDKCLNTAESCKAEAKKHVCSMQKKKESFAKKNEGKSVDEILEILRSDKYKEDAKRLRDAYKEFETLARRLGYRLVIPNFDGYAPTVLPEDVIDDVMDLLPMSYKQSGDLAENSQLVGDICPFIFD